MKALAICNFKPSLKWNWISSFLVLALALPAMAAPVFRLHLSNEPSNLDPQRQKSSAASYVLGNLYRNLLQFDDQKGLQPDLAEDCKIKSPKIIECHLKKNLHWSDGSELTSQDFLRTYRKILDPNNKVTRADFLFAVKNGKEVYKEDKVKLGITAPDKLTLRFEMKEADAASEFLYNLSSLPLSVTPPEGHEAYSGPYKLKTWIPGKSIQIVKNEYYPGGYDQRPLVEFLFIEEDSVALQLYEKNELQLLRRLPTLFIPTYKDRKDFHSIPATRFDYIGFNPALSLPLRTALTHSLRYPELQKIFSSFGVPGCAGLPADWFEGEIPCFHYAKDVADKAWKQVTPAEKEKSYTLLFSTLGGEDHKRATEWMQSQWAQVGAKINPVVRENKVYLSEMKNNPPDLFRKGISVERPSCLAALENFSEDSPENYIHLKDPAFMQILTKLRQTHKTAEQKKLCTEGVQFLLDHELLIPLGGFDFAMLIKPEFTGWRFNQMNQLDLANLKADSVSK